MNYLPYFYVLEDLETGMLYGGIEYGENKVANPNNLLKTYFTSSTVVRPLAKQNPNRFKVRKIKVFENAEQTVLFENRFLTKVKASHNPKWYNKCNSGSSWNQYERTLEWKQSRSISQKKLLEDKKKNGDNLRTYKKTFVAFGKEYDAMIDFVNENETSMYLLRCYLNEKTDVEVSNCKTWNGYLELRNKRYLKSKSSGIKKQKQQQYQEKRDLVFRIKHLFNKAKKPLPKGFHLMKEENLLELMKTLHNEQNLY